MTTPSTTRPRRSLTGGFTGAIRARAFDEFEALPMPSQETEEWRYTDLSGFELDFAPHTPGHGASGRAGHGGEPGSRRRCCNTTRATS